LMWLADAIVIDFPSTALAEASMTDKPLVVHAGRDWARMTPRAAASLGKRARISETPEQFEMDLRALLSECAQRGLTPATDDEFRRLYVTHLDDGRARRRRADVVREVLSGGGRPVERAPVESDGGSDRG